MARKETLLGQKRGSRTKVIVIIAVIAVILGVAGYFWWTKTHPAGPSMAEMAYQPQTQVAVRQDVEKLFAANGKVVSGEEGMVAIGTQLTQGSKANTTASGNQAITGDKIAEVFVHVGDLVHKGDALYSLDITELQGDLALQQQKLALSQQANYISQQAANRAVSNAQQNSAQQYNDATRHLVESADDTNHAIVDLIELQQKEADAKAAYDKASAEFNSIEGNYKQKVASRDALAQERDSLSAKIAYDKTMHPENFSSSTTVPVSDEEKKQAAQARDVKIAEADANYEKTISAKDISSEEKRYAELLRDQSKSQAEAAYNAAIADKTVESTGLTDDQKRLEQLTYDAKIAAADLSAIENSYTTAKTNYDKAKAEYETAKTARENAEKDLRVKSTRDMENQASSTLTESRSTHDAEQAARDSAAQARISNQSSLLDSEEAIRKTQEKINNSVIYAGMDGTVTAVNVTAGATYSGNNAVVINNLEKMKVIASIEEGHIADLSVGQRVYIKTDSTGADPLMGTVTYTALTPNNEDTSSSGSGTGSTSSTTGTKTKATYRVEVTLDEVNERLRIGMNANLEFILGSAKDCIAIPTSCIIDDGMGGSFVRVVQYDDEMNRETSEIEVTTGLADDYYTEITSGNITEGTEIEDPNDMGMMGGADTGLLDGMY